MLEKSPQISIKQLNEGLRQSLPTKPRVTDAHLGKVMDGCLYSLKKTLQPSNRNSAEVKSRRKDFCEKFLEEHINKTIVFLAKSSINLWTSRSYARSLISLPSVPLIGVSKS